MKATDKMSLNIISLLIKYTVAYSVIVLGSLYLDSFGDVDLDNVLPFALVLLFTLGAYILVGYITFKLRRINTHFSISSIMVLLGYSIIALILVLSEVAMYQNVLNEALSLAESLQAAFFLRGCIDLFPNPEERKKYRGAIIYVRVFATAAIILGTVSVLFKMYSIEYKYLHYLRAMNGIVFIVGLLLIINFARKEDDMVL